MSMIRPSAPVIKYSSTSTQLIVTTIVPFVGRTRAVTSRPTVWSVTVTWPGAWGRSVTPARVSVNVEPGSRGSTVPNVSQTTSASDERRVALVSTALVSV